MLENQSEKLIRVENGDNPPLYKRESSSQKLFTKSQRPPSMKPKESTISSSVSLTEDYFGKYIDEAGTHSIKRFTWRNSNRIEVQVINFGARVIALKLPDRNGIIDDVALGFDDLAGYVYYQDLYMGATIGRVANLVLNATFDIDGRQYWLTKNQPPHHFNGGFKGLDRLVWKPYISGKKVIMSVVSPQCSEGYPGDLLVRVTFELSVKNEFRIQMEAQTTLPTIVNLSNMLYVNLAGNHMGPDEVYKHLLTLNCNCFTETVPVKDSKGTGAPTGEYINVINTKYDFQVPRVLGQVIGVKPRDGFNDNFCVNRAFDQDDCFVARLYHPGSGRIVEIYSNQFGVQLKTANEFGYGEIISVRDVLENRQSDEQPDNEVTAMIRYIKKLHQHLRQVLREDYDNDFAHIVNLIVKVKVEVREEALKQRRIIISQLQQKYLKTILEYQDDNDPTNPVLDDIKNTIRRIFSACKVRNELGRIIRNKYSTVYTVSHEAGTSIESTPSKMSMEGPKQKDKQPDVVEIDKNFIPNCYVNSKKIVGKNGTYYRTHSGIGLQTQNYPCCANVKHFPSCVLKPGDTYRHNITYQFWIRAGNPNKVLKRYELDRSMLR